MSGFAVQFDAATGLYKMSVPATSGDFYVQKTTATGEMYWPGALFDTDGKQVATVSVVKPSRTEPQFTYSTLAFYQASTSASGPGGAFAFGIPTPASAVPVTGSATYTAYVQGTSVDVNGEIAGTAALNFDFGAGQLTGHMDPSIFVNDGPWGDFVSLGRYDFANTVQGVGSATFSGELVNASFQQNGAFSGRFTGPNAEELISNWRAPFHNPQTNQDSTMFGVWVGRRP
jgi:hypothetical protein